MLRRLVGWARCEWRHDHQSTQGTHPAPTPWRNNIDMLRDHTRPLAHPDSAQASCLGAANADDCRPARQSSSEGPRILGVAGVRPGKQALRCGDLHHTRQAVSFGCGASEHASCVMVTRDEPASSVLRAPCHTGLDRWWRGKKVPSDTCRIARILPSRKECKTRFIDFEYTSPKS